MVDWYSFKEDEGGLLHYRFLNVRPKRGVITMASYKCEDGRLQAWADEICNPNISVMFLFRNLSMITRDPFCPNHFITDGEKWCPLVYGDQAKFYSYPTGYSGKKFTIQDQEILASWIQQYVNWLEEQGQ